MRKINILVVPSDRFGVGYYRSVNPHTKLNSLFGNEFDVTIDYFPNFRDLNTFDKYDIIHIHKGLFRDMGAFKTALKYFKENKIVTIMDIDDYWDVGQYHPAYTANKRYNFAQLIIDNIREFDYITTTTSIFAKEISKFNQNVFVIPNAIDPNEKQFIPQDIKSDKLRIGLILGSSHEHDVNLLRGVINKLKKDVMEKIQFVLCGFDLRGSMRIFDKNGNATERPIKPLENVWYRYEKVITDDYKIVSPEYKNFLLSFIPNAEYPNVAQEHYRRCWTKNINEYATHYNNIDVLLVPLKNTKFNEMKSQLKVIEAGMFHKAIIASNFGPYTIDLKPLIEKNGKINYEGNSLLIDERSNHKDWVKNIERIVKNPELIPLLQTNLYNTVKEKYNLDNVTKDRADFYRKIVKKEL